MAKRILTRLDTYLGVAAALFLVLLNGFFVAAEFAIVKVRATQIAGLVGGGGATARLAARIAGRLDAYLAACQVGITLASLGLGWIGEPAIAGILEPPLIALLGGFAPAVAHTLAFALAFGAISFLHVVLGELAPKSLAIQKALPTTLWVAWPLHVFYTVMLPFILLLNGAGNAVVRLFGLHAISGESHAHSPEEILLVIAASEQAGTLDRAEARLVSRILGLGDLVVRSVMLPRTELVAVGATVPTGDAARTFAGDRDLDVLLVHDGSIDRVLGFVEPRDLLAIAPDRPVGEVALPPVVVPEVMPVESAFSEFSRGARVLLVVDEFGGTAGILTAERLLVAAVGGRPQDRPQIEPTADGNYDVDGLTPVGDVRELLAPAEEPEVDTVGGLVFAALGRVPAVGDQVRLGTCDVEVVAMDGRRVSRVRLRRVA